MTVTEPLPATGYGKGSWVDYSNYWRDDDTNWFQERAILRYADASLRNTQYPTPSFGQVTYREDALGAGLDRLELYSKQHNAWVPLLMLANITSTQDNASGVALSHKLSAGKGVLFGTTGVSFTGPIDVLSGIFTVDNTAVSIKTHATKVAKLTTDANNLVVDIPVSTSGLTVSGTLTAASGTISGALTAGSISMSGTLSGGGVINGASGTIGSVILSGGAVSSGSGSTGGMQSGQGHFYGDANSAVMRQRPTAGGVWSTPFVQVTTGGVNVGGTETPDTHFFDVRPTMRYYGGKGIKWYNAAGSHQAWISPTIVSAGDPGASNFPDGTIWLIP